MKVFAATALVCSILISGAVLAMPSVSDAREMPPRAISANAECHWGDLYTYHGWICHDGNLDYYCTTPRTVCWPIIPPGTHPTRGGWTPPVVAQPAQQQTRAQ